MIEKCQYPCAGLENEKEWRKSMLASIEKMHSKQDAITERIALQDQTVLKLKLKVGFIAGGISALMGIIATVLTRKFIG